MDFTKLSGAISNLLKNEAVVNSLLMLLLPFLSNVIVLAANAVSSEDGHKMVRVACRLVLDLEWKLRVSVLASPSEFDDHVLDELIEACKEIEPGYVAIA
jgi:hypothetical protein